MPKLNQRLDIQKIVKEFNQSEQESNGRKGTFKIDAPFDEAVKSILKAKPEPKKGTKRGRV